MKPKLQDTTLTMIVKDEVMNPAGGIELMLRCHLPFFEDAVVVDTGSVDGTQEILAKLKKEFSCLRWFNHQWNGFADARNYSLAQVRTPRALILDADELMEPEQIEMFGKLKTDLEGNIIVSSVNDSGEKYHVPYLAPRLTSLNGKRDLFKDNHNSQEEFIGGQIFYENAESFTALHFLPSKEAKINKEKRWYWAMAHINGHPLDNAERYGWKQFNLWRLAYHLPENLGQHPIDYLRARGAEISEASESKAIGILHSRRN